MTAKTTSRSNSAATQRPLATFGALLAWAAVAIQLVLMLQNRTASVVETLIRFFSFFTILTNTWVAVCFTNAAFAKGKQRFSAGTLTATAVYILVVGLVYNTVLRNTWNPQGMQRIVDEALHTVVPLLFVVWW